MGDLMGTDSNRELLLSTSVSAVPCQPVRTSVRGGVHRRGQLQTKSINLRAVLSIALESQLQGG